MSSMYPPTGGQTMQSCMRCGLPLLPDVPVCRNCGWYNALPPQPFANNNPGPPIQNQPANFNAFTNPQPQSQPASFNAFANPQSSGLFTPPMMNTNVFQSAPEVYQPAVNGFAPGNNYQLPQKKRGPRVGMILLIAVLLLLVIGGGSLAGYYFLVKNKANSNPVVATPTVAVVTPSVKPLFSDSFQNNTTGWDLSSTAGSYSVKVGAGQMLLEDDDNKLLWEILPGKNFGDFRLDVDAKLTKGDPKNGYGVFIRGSATQGIDIGLYYRFELYGDGTFAIFKGILDASGNAQNTQIGDYITNAAIQQEGHSNHITVIAKGGTMTFMVNGVKVYTYNDTSYKGGEVAMFVSNPTNVPAGAQAAFAHLAIFPVS